MTVLHLLQGSLSLREIGQELHLSANTIKSHTQAIYRKLGVSTRHAAVERGRADGILLSPVPGGRYAAKHHWHPRGQGRDMRPSPRSDQLELLSAPDRLVAMSCRQLAVDAPEMGLDRVHRDVHLGSDLSRAEHRRQVPEHFALTPGQRLDDQGRTWTMSACRAWEAGG